MRLFVWLESRKHYHLLVRRLEDTYVDFEVIGKITLNPDGVIMVNKIEVPRIAVAVVVTHKKSVLFGKRRLPGKNFEWQLPGGWINIGESPLQAAEREVEEETGLEIANLKFIAYTNNVFSPENHSISLCFEAECVDSEKLMIKEPDKCLGWLWLKWHEVEEKLFLPLANLKKSDYQPFISDNPVEIFSF